MARQIVQYKLNLRAALHHELCCEAEKNATSLNTELNDRLAASFTADAVRSIEAVAADLVAAHRKARG